MKKLMIALLTLISVSSFAINEGLSDSDLLKISADADVQLQSLKEFYAKESGKLNGAMNDTEGKIVAALRNIIEKNLSDIDNTLFGSHINSENDLRNIDFKALQLKLDDTHGLIDELILD